MSKRRTRLDVGIWQDAYGIAAVVKVKGVQKERRFGLDTDLAILRRWQATTRAALEDGTIERTSAPSDAGTFRADAARHLKTIAHRVKYKSDRSHLSAWFPIVGELRRGAVTKAHVEKAIGTWTTAGKSARTIRHRVRVLREFFAALDPHRTSPTDGVDLPRPADPHPVAVPIDTIRRVAESLRAGLPIDQACGPKRTVVRVERAEPKQTHARFLVLATTGQRPSQIMRAEPADVDLERRIWFVRAGKGGTQVPFPLNPEAVGAWKTFIAADAWGTFNARSFAQTLRRHGWPKGIRPYALRSTFAIDLLLKGASLDDVQGLLGHRQIQTTRTHYAPILTALLAKTVRKRRIGWHSTSQRRKTAPKSLQNATTERRRKEARLTSKEGRK